MENHRDVILQALNFGCTFICPTIYSGLYFRFSSRGLTHAFLKRLDKLGLNYTKEFIDEYEDVVIIKIL